MLKKTNLRGAVEAPQPTKRNHPILATIPTSQDLDLRQQEHRQINVREEEKPPFETTVPTKAPATTGTQTPTRMRAGRKGDQIQDLPEVNQN